MAITLITGPANAGKARAIIDAVRLHQAHGEMPLLVVPTRADAEHYLRELAGDGAAMGVRMERFEGLIGELVRRAGVGEPLLEGLARECVLGAVAAREGARVSPGFVRALGELFAELRTRRVSPARLKRALADWRAVDGPRAHPHDLGELFDDYCRRLARLGRMDREQRAVRALDELRERPALWGDRPVLLYGFDDLTGLQLDVVETLGGVVDAPVTVSLTYEGGREATAGRAASYHALAPLAREHRTLPARAEHYAPSARAALGHLERRLFEADAPRERAGTAVRLLEGGGERAELELVAREIATLLEDGVPAMEIAVLVRMGGTDVDLLEEVLAHARVPYELQRRRPFASSAVGAALLGLLRCVPAANAGPAVRAGRGATPGAGELGDLLAWLRAPGLLRAGGAQGGASPADRLELTARRTGAVRAADARALWEQRNWPLDTLEHLAEAQERGPLALCERAARELQWLFSAPRRREAAVLAPDERDEAAALAAGRRALAQLRELARTERALVPADAAALADALEALEFVSSTSTSGAAEREAVSVLDPLALRARRVRALFVCGLQEGVFPASARQQPLLSEEERRRLAELTGLRLGEAEHSQAGQLAAERYLLYAAVSRPQERLYLSWHDADDDGEASPRSLFVDDVCDLFDGELWERRERRALGAVELPAAPSPPAPERCLHAQPLLEGLREHVWSPSSLERFIGCPMSWFVERMLRPEPFEPDPEALARGGLAHAVLKDTLEVLRARTGSARVTVSSLPLARELLARALQANGAEHPLSTSPERDAAVRRRLAVDLERYLAHAADSASRLEPRELELGFGFTQEDERGGASELPALELGGGVKLRGRIDRVDASAAGEAVVVDYKGGRAPAGARWIADGNVQVALYMRAVEQLLDLDVVGGFYQPLTGEDLRARGVLDVDAGVELDCVAPDALAHERMRELLEEALALARTAAAEAARGELEARPATCAFRGGCMFPSICRCER